MQSLIALYRLQQQLIRDAETPLEYLHLQRICTNIMREGYRRYGQSFLDAIS